ncbi:hypothetical protein T01_3893 [Trichinella spiralis]|uniref:PiggyBac transposable element-derived protein domain-containing protein n=1 Tax=Trichinella spiralis TaxID=6334 RepID=A0A0V1BAM8_TRISP|nr:hypothetical protein T01_3893 [Trichinella spiralis]
MPRKVESRQPVRCEKRPNIINDYNLGKGGVDSMDARIDDFCYQQIEHADAVLHHCCIHHNAFVLMSQQQSY